ncbi:MAG: peptide ABC transporter substrate-binding protein [Anaerolineales bacterium]
MKRLRWQILIVVIALIAIGVLLLGQQPSALPGIEAVIEPTTGGAYTEALIGSLGRLNPLLDAANPADRAVDRLLYSSLIRFDSRGSAQGDLAESWGISQDGTVYNFSLRNEAVWHDGVPVTSEDVIFTIELMRDENLPLPPDLQEFLSQIEVGALNEKTLQFRLPESFAPFLDHLTFGILPKHLLGNLTAQEIINAPFNLNPVGSGPYQFDALQMGNEEIRGVALSAFDDYYEQQPFIEEVFFQYYPDSPSAFAAYQEGEVMGISEITPDVLDSALKEADLKLFTGRRSRLNLVFLNLDIPSLPFLQDPLVRRALLMGINRSWIVDRLLGGQAIVAHGPVFPESWAYYEGIEQLNYDSEAAVDLLKGAGYTIPAEGGDVRAKEGVRLAFEMVYPEGDEYGQIAESIQKDWQKLGVQVDLKPISYDELLNDYLEPRTYQAALVELNLDRSPDPDPYPFWHQAQITGGQNYSGWDDRQASEYLEQARVLVSAADRTKRYRNFQVRFASEMPALPLFYPVYSFAIDRQVQGVSMGPLYEPSDRLNTITSWYLVAKPSIETPLPPTATP